MLHTSGRRWAAEQELTYGIAEVGMGVVVLGET